MFGLLGGLLGGGMRMAAARRPMGGVLRGLTSMKQRGGGGSTMARAESRPAQQPQSVNQPAEQTSEEPAGNAQAQQARPTQPSAPAPLVQTASSTIQAAQPKPASPLSGLLSEAPPTQPAPEPMHDQQPKAVSVVNQTAAATPVARPADEQFGATPATRITEMADQITRPAPAKLPRLRVPMIDANPSRQPDLPKQSYTADQGFRFQGPSISDAMAQFRYTR